MKRMAIIVSMLVVGLPSAAFAHAWKVDSAHSALTFTGTYQDEKFEGRFKRFDAKVDYDPADLAHSKFDVIIDLASIDTANTERDQALPGKDFFDTAQFPRAHFVTTRFRKGANGTVLADGTLSLRGVGKPVTLSVKFSQTGNGATLDVDTTLKRLDFGIGGGDWADTTMIGNEVAAHGHLALLP
ncbi:MAG: YceI family protein [Rhodanobacteraceae bacterium]